ncbi:hypothetical protein J7E96_34010 [Streptomyces sp. ISL-96]|uniref:hypothetical protein n=1 Tax=Streptomyces sp. ISL-96 TaxID=2819191 RepID=UPI001BE6885E|nr:hypothetical protein [Streptomyces sp. ISL-96]MBT2493431.1 hypothetical protein [Streptomyces sp. ISL-96]
MDIQVLYRSAAGRSCLHDPERLRGVPLEERPALSEPRAYKGRRSILTKWSSSTTGLSVWCASNVQMDAAMLLDFDRDIECFQSGVAQVRWQKGNEHGAVQPAFFARTRDGRRLAIVHQRPRARGEEAAMQQAAEAAGWEVRQMEVPQGVLRPSLARLAHFRAAEYADPHAREVLLKAFAEPQPLAMGVAACGLGREATSRAWHLLWTGELTTDWSAPLLPTSVVWARGKERT